MVKQNTLKEATEIPKFYIFESPYCKEDIQAIFKQREE